jgi:hypothetical protein
MRVKNGVRKGRLFHSYMGSHLWYPSLMKILFDSSMKD